MIEENQKKIDQEFQIPTVAGLINSVAIDQKMNIDQIYPWNVPNCVYPVIVKLLKTKDYAYHLLKGLVVSVGGITGTTSQVASAALNAYLNKLEERHFNDLMETIILILVESKGNERLTIPIIKTLEIIFENNDFCDYPNMETYAQ